LWNVALGYLVVNTGSAWVQITGGANFPTNTNITSMTGIPNTAINSTGYFFTNADVTANGFTFDNGTPADKTTVGAAGWSWGSANFTDGTGGVFVANQAFTGTGYTGIGVAVQNTSGVSTIIGAGSIGTNDIKSSSIEVTGVSELGTEIRVGSGTVATPGLIHSYSPGQALTIGPLGTTTYQTAILFDSGQTVPTSGVGLIGFDANYATQTTVGAAGAASAIPGAPKKYIQITDTDGTIVVFPVWAHA